MKRFFCQLSITIFLPGDQVQCRQSQLVLTVNIVLPIGEDGGDKLEVICPLAGMMETSHPVTVRHLEAVFVFSPLVQSHQSLWLVGPALTCDVYRELLLEVGQHSEDWSSISQP